MAEGMMNYNKPLWKNIICFLDCRTDNRLSGDFLCLNIWGKPVFSYALETVRKAGIFKRIVVVTKSVKIKKKLNKEDGIELCETFDFSRTNGAVCVFSGRAAMVNAVTLRNACLSFTGGILYTSARSERFNLQEPSACFSFLEEHENKAVNAFVIYQVIDGKFVLNNKTEFVLNSEESVVINGINDFELSIVLKKKQNNTALLKQMILNRIEEKRDIISTACVKPSICLIGHSQMDYWSVDELAGFKIRNCGIAGISSFEYTEQILNKDMLNCEAEAFIVMHGTNDIVLTTGIKDIVLSISHTIDYIKGNNDAAPVYFIACIHVNGRMDRNNCLIDELNKELRKELEKQVIWINTDFMDNEFNELKPEYTTDGLHLSDKGYDMLGKQITKYIIGEMTNAAR